MTLTLTRTTRRPEATALISMERAWSTSLVSIVCWAAYRSAGSVWKESWWLKMRGERVLRRLYFLGVKCVEPALDGVIFYQEQVDSTKWTEGVCWQWESLDADTPPSKSFAASWICHHRLLGRHSTATRKQLRRRQPKFRMRAWGVLRKLCSRRRGIMERVLLRALLWHSMEPGWGVAFPPSTVSSHVSTGTRASYSTRLPCRNTAMRVSRGRHDWRRRKLPRSSTMNGKENTLAPQTQHLHRQPWKERQR